MKYYIGIDNGCSGSISFISESKKDVYFQKMPIKKMFDYTSSGQKINRIDHIKLKDILQKVYSKSKGNIFCFVERAFTMPKFYKASISSAKALESVLIILEQLYIPYEIISSMKWQKEMLKRIKGSKYLKEASLQLGYKLFPKINNFKHGDFDSLLMAEYCRRNKL